MSNFEKKIILQFKRFFEQETDLPAINFNSDVFLENQYGATPVFNYARADAIISTLLKFFGKYSVDYEKRYDKGMVIEILRTTPLSIVLVSSLRNELLNNELLNKEWNNILEIDGVRVDNLKIDIDASFGKYELAGFAGMDDCGLVTAKFSIDSVCYEYQEWYSIKSGKIETIDKMHPACTSREAESLDRFLEELVEEKNIGHNFIGELNKHIERSFG